MQKLVLSFLKAVLPGVVRPLHVLWNEMIGSIFVLLAISALPSIWRYYKELGIPGTDSVSKLVLSGVFFAVMAYFGVSSFWRARRIGRASQTAQK